MSFQGKYQILSTLSTGECRSFRAQEIDSGRTVLIHHIAANRTPSDQPDLESLIFQLLRGGTGNKPHFLDMGEEEGRTYVVTADVPECLNLRQWLESVVGEQAGKESEISDHGSRDFYEQLAGAAAASGPAARSSAVFADPWAESNDAPPQAAAPVPFPGANQKPQAAVNLKTPRRRIPPGFEVIYRSTNPRWHHNFSDSPDESRVGEAPALIAPVVVNPMVGAVGGNPAVGSPVPVEQQSQEASPVMRPSIPPLASPPLQPGMGLEETTLLVQMPVKSKAGSPPPTPLGDSSPDGRDMPSILAPRPAAPSQGQSDEYTRLFENLSPVESTPSLGSPISGDPPEANPAVPDALPIQSQPLPSMSPEAPSPPASKRRTVWLPILIVSCLLLVAGAVLLFFFAFKH